MKALPAEWYDALLDDPERAEPLLAEGDDFNLATLYAAVYPWLVYPRSVVDLGCGTGRFAAYLALYGFSGGYVGYDFSDRMLAAARAHVTADGFYFLGYDLRDWRPTGGDTTYVCLETLEHLDDDFALVAKIPAGCQFIFSVPNFDANAHVRVYPSASHVHSRFHGLLRFDRQAVVEFPGSASRIFAFDTVRL